MQYAYCWSDGRVKVGKCVPPGALPIIAGDAAEAMRATGWRNGHYRVPGVAQARGEEEAVAAVAKFRGTFVNENGEVLCK